MTFFNLLMKYCSSVGNLNGYIVYLLLVRKICCTVFMQHATSLAHPLQSWSISDLSIHLSGITPPNTAVWINTEYLSVELVIM